MANLNHRNSPENSQGWRRFYTRYRDSDTTLGIALAVIAMLFIAGIVTAFIHAADTNPVLNARNNANASAAETTGSGSSAGK